ncbi:hypothetical protein Dole_2780 [Desulfosudis oleivorans Hxd3]|uniref:Uncharacterized protein n=2 Tax=Desulfosudis TaxID=2904716 RepID=A8ZXV6_DESOH|nr:hypothetical protein Dole_2780 [Desulfosudis oleivorans Hxd3]
MPVQLGLRLPSRKRFFRRGQELARFAVLKQPARFLPKKPSPLGCAAMGESNRYSPITATLSRQTPVQTTTRFKIVITAHYSVTAGKALSISPRLY